jgi:hypothetical protein
LHRSSEFVITLNDFFGLEISNANPKSPVAQTKISEISIFSLADFTFAFLNGGAFEWNDAGMVQILRWSSRSFGAARKGQGVAVQQQIGKQNEKSLLRFFSTDLNSHKIK